jgi:aldose 1-epimerase
MSESVLKINTSEWLGEIAVDAGANLYRLKHKSTGMELLRSPSSLDELRANPQMYGIPVLLPPNRIGDGRFAWQGREYTFPINEPERRNHLHGLILGMPWKLVDAGENYAVMTYDFAATDGFPHDFALCIIYRFSSKSVSQEFKVTNKSDLPMPLLLGFHTAFRMSPQAKVQVTASDGYWEMDTFRHLPEGKLISWNKSPVYEDNQAVSCHCPVTTDIIDGKPFRGAIIDYPENNTKLYYEFDEAYKHWCLWNQGGNNQFFCPEPMTCMVNAPNLNLPTGITGIEAIEPGHTWQARQYIRLVRQG